MSDILIRIAKNIKAIRESKDMTQEELARLSNLHRNFIISIEKAKRNVSINSLEKISQALNVKLERLLE